MTRPRHPTNTQTSPLRVPPPGIAPSSPRSGRPQSSRAHPGSRRVLAPITSPVPCALGQNLTGCLARLRLPVTGFPQWENGKRGENGPLCVPFCTISRVGASSPGRGQPLHLSPAPGPGLGRSGAIQHHFAVSGGFQIPQPQLAPPKPGFSPFQRRTRHN